MAMKLSKRQRQFLKTAHHKRTQKGYDTCFVMPEPSNGAARRTVLGLVKRKLVEWVDNDDWPPKTEYRITAKGRAAYNATIPVPEVTPREFGRMEEDDLRTFVLHYCDQQILCDFQVDPNILGSVFMPLMFGALSLPDELQPEEPTTPKPQLPEPPEKPEPPPKPKMEAEPTIPARLLEMEGEIREFRNRIEWEDADDEDLEAFMASIADDKAKLEAEWEQAQATYRRREQTHEENMALWRTEKAAQAREHKAALRQHDKDRVAYDKARAAYEAEIEVVNEIRGRTTELYLANLGIVYEYYNKGGPRSVDGFPTFGSCRLLHKLDWQRAQKAIDRELARRKEIEI
jgi:hypothetical protein